MGVCGKGRRKIIYGNIEYVWYVSEDYDSMYYILNIISKDKRIILSYPLKTETSYIISKGGYFQGKKTNGLWNRYLLPFSTPKSITPNFVSKIIAWAAEGTNAVEIQWNGADIPI